MCLLCASDHAAAAAGVAYCASRQSLHLECISACQRAVSLLGVSEGDSVGAGGADVATVTSAVLQLMAASLEVIGKPQDAIK